MRRNQPPPYLHIESCLRLRETFICEIQESQRRQTFPSRSHENRRSCSESGIARILVSNVCTAPAHDVSAVGKRADALSHWLESPARWPAATRDNSLHSSRARVHTLQDDHRWIV